MPPKAKRQKREENPKEVSARLMYAIEKRDWYTTEQFLRDSSLNLDVVVDTYTPLLTAIAINRIDFVRLLVSHGANVNLVSSETKKLPLHRACSNGNVEVVKYLLEMGADINMIDPYQRTALYHATFRQHLEVVYLLLDKGATVYFPRLCSGNPIGYATHATSRIFVELIRHGVPVYPDVDALYWAVRRRNKDSVVLFMECGSNPHSQAFWSKIDQTEDPAFFTWCQRFMSRPVSLKCLSAQVVRRRLAETRKTSILPYLTQLELPKTLVDHLALERFR